MKKLLLILVVLLIAASGGWAQVVTTAGKVNFSDKAVGATVTIPVTVTGFTDITAVSLKLGYNSSVLTYVNASAPDLPGLLAQKTNGNVVISWAETPTIGAGGVVVRHPVTLAGGSVIVNLNFTVASYGTSLLTWKGSTVGDCEYQNLAGTLFGYSAGTFINGYATGLAVTLAATNPTCASAPLFDNGSVIATVTGGNTEYSFVWSNGPTTKDISGLTDGSFSVTVTDALGAVVTSTTVTLIDPVTPVHNLTKGTNFCTIQAAIDYSSTVAGDDIYVDAGTYLESVTINKSIHLQGTPLELNPSIIQAPSTLPAASDPLSNIVLITGSGINAELSGLTIQGPGPTACGSMGRGIFVRDGATANIHHNQILDIRDNVFSGCQNGIAIQVGRNFWTTTGTAIIKDNLITGYQKGGIVVDNTGSSAVIDNNTITGAGTTAVIGQNGIQVSRGAQATLTNNVITKNSFQSTGHPDNYCGTGLLLYQSGAVALAGGNNLSGNDQNYYAYEATGTLTLGAEIFGASAAPVTFGYNIVNYSNQNIDATNCTFAEGIPSSASLTELFAIEDRISHSVDDQAKTGFVKVKTGNVYVTRTETGAHIQFGIDAASAGDMVNVQAGDYGIETAANRSVFGTGSYMFGLFIDKDNLTVKGYKSGDVPVSLASEAGVLFNTGSTADFGPSGVFVQAKGVKLEGLKIGDNYVAGAIKSNKTIEVVGDAFAMTKCFVNTSSDEGAFYMGAWDNAHPIVTYSLTGNLFNNALVSINNGAGTTGTVAGRVITGNTFTGLATPYLIGFRGWNGASPAQGWIVSPVGGAIVTGNIFNTTGVVNYVIARGNAGGYINSQLNWADIWNLNTFGNHVVTLSDFATFAVRPYSDAAGYTETRRITPFIQENADKGLTGDVVLVSAGTYSAEPTLNIATGVTLRGANYGVSCSGTRGTESIINGTGGSAVTIASDGVTIDGFRITNTLGNNAISADSKNSIVISNNIITQIGSAGVLSGNSHAVAISSMNADVTGVTISNNCFSDIHGGENSALSGAAAKANNGSASAIGVGWSNANFNVGGLLVKNNTITDVRACIKDFAEGGKGAYGVIINVGANPANTGNVASPIVQKNDITNLEGLWAHGVGLEGNTPAAVIENNFISNLTHHKTTPDGIGVLLEDNAGAGSVQIKNNSFTVMDLGIVNLMTPAVNASCNWFGATDPATVASKLGGAVTSVPWLTSGSDSDGGAPGFVPATACAACDLALTEEHVDIECPTVQTTGSIDLSVTGGVPELTYLWTGPGTFSSTAQDLTGLAVGTYNVTVTGLNGCTATRTVVLGLQDRPAPFVTTPGSSTVNCLTAATAPLTVETLDQQQLQIAANPNWTDFTSIGQSFTCMTSGKLTKIQVLVGSLTGTQNFTLKIFVGNGIGGTKIYEGAQTLSGTGWQSLVIAQGTAPLLTANTQYTFWFTEFTYRTTGLLCMTPSTYSGGVGMDGCVSGCSPTYDWQQWPAYDLVFKTFMTAPATNVPVVTDACGTVIPTPVPVMTSSLNNCGFGTVTYTYTYTDYQPKSTDWTYMYTIVPADFSIAQANGTSTVTTESLAVAPSLPTVTDYCGNVLTPTSVKSVNLTNCVGTIVYTYTYTDCSNFSHNWVYTYTVTGLTISGVVNYLDGPATPMIVTVKLMQGIAEKYSVISTNGQYEFLGVCPGNYEVRISSANSPGGINSTDAAQVNFWGISPSSIEKAKFLAADVDGYLSVNSNDAALIQGYFLHEGVKDESDGDFFGFARSAWSFWKAGESISTVTIPSDAFLLPVGNNHVTGLNFKGLVTGDFNGSFAGLKSAPRTLELKHGETSLVAENAEYELPVISESNMQVGAISMILDYPSDQVSIGGIYLRSDRTVPVRYAVSGNELRISWYSTEPVSVKAGERLLTLNVKTNGNTSEEDIRFSLTANPLNELADDRFEVISDAALRIGVLKSSSLPATGITGDSELTFANFPNPFSSRTNFTYTLPVKGKVVLEIRDMLGRIVKQVINTGETAGSHTTTLEANTLSSGMYYATIRLTADDNKVLTQTIKIVSTK